MSKIVQLKEGSEPVYPAMEARIVYNNSFTYNSNWETYADTGSNNLSASKSGRVVQIAGAVKRKTAQTSVGSDTIGKVPSGYEPARATAAVCHGSSMNIALVTIGTDGTISVDRYGTTTNIVIPAGVWLKMNLTYISAT